MIYIYIYIYVLNRLLKLEVHVSRGAFIFVGIEAELL